MNKIALKKFVIIRYLDCCNKYPYGYGIYTESVGKNAKQFVFEESGELLGKVTFELSKGMSELCKFVADDELRPVMNYIGCS